MNEPRGSTDDIYDDLDTLFNPEPVKEIKQDGLPDVPDFTKAVNTMTNGPSQSSSTSNCSLNEDQLKKEEMILYLDLVVTEMDNKKALLNLKTEYMNLKKETDALRKSLSEKDEKISQLTTEVVTLKKNICSLYKTAKFEIEQKDAMLQEANKEIDKVYTHSDKSTFQNKRHSTESSQCRPSISRMSHVPTQNLKQLEDRCESKEVQNYKNKRKRSYETSESENPAFTRPSSSFSPPENRSKQNRVHSNHKFSHREFGKHKHSLSHDTINEKHNFYNYKNRRKNYNKSKSYQINHSKEERPQK
ncbi:unnamed protein product [Larinioides sclopetarius]|uniref:Uncharacterized protein n=1 Tax=Larinioides sclopetarius TaxID=280406 RepID=A0AAV2B2W9_9ARAC